MKGKLNNKFWSAAWGGCLAVAVLLVSSGTASGQSSKVSKDLQSLPSATSVNVAIQYYNPPTSTDANYARSVGATPGKAVGLIKGSGYAAMSPTAAAKLVSLDTNVKYISVDRKLQIASTIANDSVMNTTVSANLARGMGYDGTGVGVAVIDSGVNPTADLGVPGSPTAASCAMQISILPPARLATFLDTART